MDTVGDEDSVNFAGISSMSLLNGLCNGHGGSTSNASSAAAVAATVAAAATAAGAIVNDFGVGDGSDEDMLDFTDDSPLTTLKVIISTIYLVLSLAFFCNIAVTIIVGNILVKAHNSLPHPQMFVYILFLSIVDALVLIHLPLVVADFIASGWLFGRVMCKVYWTLENIGKVLSTFVLTAVSADRYLVVCHPNRFMSLHTVRAAVLILVGITTAAILLLYPIYVHSKVITLQLIQNVTVTKCVFTWESDNECKFVLYIFSLGYFTPLCLKAYFYTNIILSIRRSSKVVGMNLSRERQIRELTFRVLTLVVFYFICWTPYWAVTFFICYTEAQFSKWLIIGFYSVYVLAYLNSAVNPLLYALLNMELRRQHSFVTRRNSRVSYEKAKLCVECRDLVVHNNGNGGHSHPLFRASGKFCFDKTFRAVSA